jgi:hypothetical protein
MSSHVTWTIVTGVADECSAFFFSIKESKKGDSWALTMKAVVSFESSTTIYQITRRNIRDSLFISITSLRD